MNNTFQAINYYNFDSIEKEDGTFWGYKNGQILEVFPLSVDDTEEQLIEAGFAKCDAPNVSETFLIEETAWKSLSAKF